MASDYSLRSNMTQSKLPGPQARYDLAPLYARTVKGAVQEWRCWVIDATVYVAHGLQGGKMQESPGVVCTPKNVGRTNATDPHTQAIMEATAKWEKQKKRKYSETLDEEREQLRPMLAQSFTKLLGKTAKAQVKFDGVRCLAYLDQAGEIVLQSRGGDPYLVPHVVTALQPLRPFLEQGLVLDGELYWHGKSLQEVVSLVKRNRPESAGLAYYVYDCGARPGHTIVNIYQAMDARTTWVDREYVLYQVLRGTGDAVIRVESAPVASMADIQAEHDRYVQEGYEGLILRYLDGLYEWGARSKNLLKYKRFDDGEFKVVGYRAGVGKFAQVPVFECLVDHTDIANKTAFEVVVRGTAEDRALMLVQAPHLLGQMLTVRYFGQTDEGVPRFPVGVAIRPEGT